MLLESVVFWESSVWSILMLFTVLLGTMLIANFLKKSIKFLRNSLIPTSVLGGILLLIAVSIFKIVTKTNFFDLDVFGGNGSTILEIITYHGLGIGFVAVTLHTASKKLDKKRTIEVLDTGMTTVSTYLMQAILGIAITASFAFVMTKLLPASGILLAFGYGQGTGQALNFGNIYENTYGFDGGASFGLTIAALGFLSAAIGGVIYLNILRKKGKIKFLDGEVTNAINYEDVQRTDEIAMNASIDKMTIQVAIVITIYMIAYLCMLGLSQLVPSLQSVLFGFNFLFGVIIATLVKLSLRFLTNKKVIKKQYINPFLMNRISGFAFDLMIIAGIAAIQIDLIKEYWYVLTIMGLVGAFTTFFYLRLVCMKNFKEYQYEQFFAMYGMLTGTASTGMILLREIDPEFKSPASDNLVFQNFPAIVLGFPMMLLANYAPQSPMAAYITAGISFAAFIILNICIFRKNIFRKKAKVNKVENVE